MKKDPVTTIGLTSILLLLALLMAALETQTDKKSGAALVFTVLFLQMGMWHVYKAFKHQQKRIDALEKKLDTNQTEEKA